MDFNGIWVSTIRCLHITCIGFMLIVKKSCTREYGHAFRTSQESVGGSLLSQPIQSSKVNKCWTIACNDEEDLNYL